MEEIVGGLNAKRVGNDAEPNVNGQVGQEIITKQREAKIEQDVDAQEQTLFEYRPMSLAPTVGGFTPVSLYSETTAALNRMKADVGDIDEYVKAKLKYKTLTDLWEAFAAEQVDAIAQQIYTYEKRGNAIVLADMAGMGKGRVCAGISRYAYIAGLIPVFITEKPNLFSDLYRDFNDIGGFPNLDKKITGNLPVPFIVNAGSKENVINHKNKRIKIAKAGKEDIFDPRTPSELKELGLNSNILFTSQKQSIINSFFRKNEFPNNIQICLSTYSQFSGQGADARSKFFIENADKCFFILDESHNAAGNSATGRFFQQIAIAANGIMFSSATYAKRVDNLKLYGSRNSMQQLGSNSYISEVLDKGRDRLNEYVATGLAEAGELVRRERSFAQSIFKTISLKKNEAANTNKEYDSAIEGYIIIKKIIDSAAYKSSLKYLIEEQSSIHKIKLAPDYNKDEHGNRENYKELYKDYYTYTCSIGAVGRNHFNFIEQLLFSVKADTVANAAIAELQRTIPDEGDSVVAKATSGNKEDDYVTGSTKPIIAVKNTLEGIFIKLGIEKNQVVERGDFSLYFEYLVSAVTSGSLSFTNVKDRKKAIVIPKISLPLQDRLAEVVQMAKEHLSELEFKSSISPIDAVIDRVQSATEQAEGLFRKPGENFICREVSGRKTRFIRVEGGYMLIENNLVERNAASAFAKFNNGLIDFLIINQSGSTGASAHSGPKFKDSRPRSMLIHQVELNVQTEVQKRGRINRTGQKYFPRYVYIISSIPSEARRYVMLMKKMKTLDALTTGNRNQGLKNVEIEIGDGKKVEDFVNNYGWQVAESIWADILANGVKAENNQYVFPVLTEYNKMMLEKTKNETDKVEILLRIMEIQKTAIQIYFYDEVNKAYQILVEDKIANGEWDLDTEYRDFKGVTRNRFEVLSPTGDGIFQQGVYAEDCWITADDKGLTKEEVDALIFKNLDGGKITAEEAKQRILDRIDLSKNNLVKKIKDEERERFEANIQFIEEDRKEDFIKQYEDKLNAKVMTAELRYDEVSRFVNSRLKIGANYRLPDILRDREANAISYALGKLVGIRVLEIPFGRDYNTLSEFEMEFAYFEGLTNRFTFTFVEKPDAKELRERIVPLDGAGADYKVNEAIDNWIITKRERINARFLSGNLFKAYSIADDYKNYANKNLPLRQNYGSRVDFVKFSLYKSMALKYSLRLYSSSINAPVLTSYSPPYFALIGSPETIEKIYDVNVRQSLALEQWVKDVPYLYLDSHNQVLCFIKGTTGKKGKPIGNPMLEDADWQSKTGVQYWSEAVVFIRKPGNKKDTKFSCFYTRLGRGYNQLDFESFSTLMKYIGKYFPAEFILSSRKEDIQAVEQADKFNEEIEINAPVQDEYEFYYPHKSLDKIAGLQTRPLRQEPYKDKGWLLYFNKFLSVYDLQTYHLVPTKIEPNTAVELILQGLNNDTNRLKFVEALKKAVDSDKPDAELYADAFGKFSIYFGYQESIFGGRNNRERGKLLRDGLDAALAKINIAQDVDVIENIDYQLNRKNAAAYLARLKKMIFN